MNRHPLKEKYWQIGKEKVAEIQHWFLISGDSDKAIADKFGLDKTMVSRITKDALKQYQNAKANELHR